MLIIDAHEDLAYNILTFGRDYTLSAHEIRRRESGSDIALWNNGEALLGYPDFRRGRVAVVFSTLFALPERRKAASWDAQSYADFEQAHDLYMKQLEQYLRLTDDHPDHYRLVRSRADLRDVLEAWEKLPEKDEAPQEGEPEAEQPPEEQPPAVQGPPVGLVILMEGAEGVRSPDELEEWWELGLRIIGPAWVGTRYSGGTSEPGPLTRDGFALLEAMSGLGFGLDLTHMDEQAALQALDAYPGTIIASHSNARALLRREESNRHLSDIVIRRLIERDGVMGIVPFNRFLLPGWAPEDGRERVTLQMVAAQVDYVCQMAGDARHVGLGTDYDGGFGWPAVPLEIDTIADLQKLVPLLAEKGYTEQDIAAVLGRNWSEVLQRILPESV